MQNVVSGIDGATGRVRTNPETLFTAVGQQRFICPTVNGGKNFQAGAYSPLTNTMYYALQNACATVTAIEDTPTTIYAIQNNNQIAPGTDKIGTVQAISVETGKTVWKYEQRAGYMSLVATGGGLIFGGDTNGRFRAFDQNSGAVLWEINLSEHCAILANSVMPMCMRSMWHLCRHPMIAVPKDKKHERVSVAMIQRCSIREAMEPRGGELSILALKKDATKQAFLPIRIALQQLVQH